MGIKYSFVDSVLYGTEDINDIARSLVGAGIAPFLSKDSYNTSDLNALTQAIASQGVQLDGCKVKLENVSTADMIAAIGQGIVFFENGVRLEVDSDGYFVAVTPNVAGYIFAHFSTSLQVASIQFAEELPDDGEYVLLAQVSDSGEVFDKRVYARSKLATLGKNITKVTSFEAVTPEDISVYPYAIYVVGEVKDADTSQYNYAIIEVGGDYGNIIVDLNVQDGQKYEVGKRSYDYVWDVQMRAGRLCFIETATLNAQYRLSGICGNQYTIRLV